MWHMVAWGWSGVREERGEFWRLLPRAAFMFALRGSGQHRTQLLSPLFVLLPGCVPELGFCCRCFVCLALTLMTNWPLSKCKLHLETCPGVSLAPAGFCVLPYDFSGATSV